MTVLVLIGFLFFAWTVAIVFIMKSHERKINNIIKEYVNENR
jgi:hypothetical protein